MANPRPIADRSEYLELYCQPGAGRTQVTGFHDERIKIRLAAPPVEGAANAALIKFIAKACGVRQSDVRILAGEQSRYKRIQVQGITAMQISSKLLPSGR